MDLQHDRIIYDLQHWCYYIISFVALYVANIFGQVLHPFTSNLAIFWMDYDHGPGSRTAYRRALKYCNGSPILRGFDCRFMAVSFYMLYPWWSMFLSSRSRWHFSLVRSMEWAEDIIYLPTCWLMERAILWPPDGYILASYMFVLITASQLFVSGVQICRAIFAFMLRQLSKFHLQMVLDALQKIWSLVVTVFGLRGRLFHLHSISYNLDIFAFATKISTCLQSSSFTHDSHVFSADFSTDTRKAVVDNSANTHIWSHREDFITGSLHYFKDSDSVGVLTIGNKESRPVGVGIVPIHITDDHGTKHKILLQKALYFPDSPVNIISVTALADLYNDDEGTWVKTKRHSSILTWDHEQNSIEFHHPTTRLPVISINSGNDEFEAFCSLFDDSSDKNNSPMAFATCHSTLPLDSCDDVCFATDAVDENPPLSADLIQHIRNESFKVGDRLRLSKNGLNQNVDVTAVRVDPETGVSYFRVALRDGQEQEVTKEFLFPLDDDDVALIPITAAQIRRHVSRLDPASVEALLAPSTDDTALLKEFMAWHVRLGHIPFQRMFRLCEHKYLPKRFLRLRTKPLICPSCLFGKQKRRPWRTKAQPGTIRHAHETQPGDATSIDHVISHQPGLVPRMDGRHTKQRINSACVFIDHVSGLSYSHLQTSVDNEQTIQAKLGYEQFADSHGVTVKSFRADNGVFAEKAFRDAVQASNQTITFCAVGAHHQNGIVERHIGILSNGARANLLHAQRRWPKAIGSILWPFAWKHYERQHNHLSLDDNGRSPMQKFTGLDIIPDLKDFHPFGCPVFVLDSRLQSEMSAIPKWEPRSRVGVYLGHSPCHAGSVALVLNPRTLRVSPQYHLVFDDEFSTVPYMTSGEVPPHWAELVKTSANLATDDDFDLATSWANDYISGKPTAINEEGVESSANALNKNATTNPPTTNSEEAKDDTISEEESKSEEASDSNDQATPSIAPSEAPTNQLLFPTMPDLNELTCRRSARIREQRSKASKSSSSTVRKLFSMFVVLGTFAFGYGESCISHLPSTALVVQKVCMHTERLNLQFDGTINKMHFAVLSTALGDNDTYTLKDMMKQEDKAQFIVAMKKEVDDHVSREHWTMYERSVMPPGTKTILSIWSFKRKRFPDGRVMKHKARLCAHGGMQTWGVNYWETYAPVVNWLSVRTLLIISLMHDLEAKSVDFVLAFPQVELKKDVWMELPFGFDVEGKRNYILKLNKNLYGLKDASRTFWMFLKEGLEARGYKRQSSTDCCVFYGKDAIVLVYVDDMIIFSRKGTRAGELLVEALGEGHENFVFTDDGDLDKYLGVDVKRYKDGRIELTQPHLIERFLAVIGYDKDVNPRPTPAVKPILNKDADGLPRKTDWNYRQAIGMLNYLTAISRPEMSMAVHQAARFTIDPKLSHERAVQRIGKYLIGTKDKGIIFKPDTKKGLECFVDADFAGGWSQATAEDASTVLSRTGYVINFAGCPLIWCSKLQTEIALSTTEAEYIALSQALREVIPIMELLKEVNEIFPIDLPKPKVHCKVWEDNNGCIALAKGEKFSPRTKHIGIKYHHFRSHIRQGTIVVLPIDTKEQTADIFTKPLDESLFIYLRMKLNGW